MVFSFFLESAKLDLNDFNKVFQNFKPASLHGMKFHLGNDLSWQDVGGLHDIKQTLKETLEWPAKVCMCIMRKMFIHADRDRKTGVRMKLHRIV